MERQLLQRAKEAFVSGRARPLEFRLQQLHALQRMILEKETEISTALKQDINRVRGHTTAGAPNIHVHTHTVEWCIAGFGSMPAGFSTEPV